MKDPKPLMPETKRFQIGDRVIHPAGIIRGVVRDIGQGLSAAEISGRFHATLVRLFTDLCARLARRTGVKTVALSGGVFQNRLLLEGLSHSLRANGLTVLSHRQVPANDGGISLGQAAVAAARFGK